MTRKHFIAVAKTLRANNADFQLCWNLARDFKLFNPFFDENKFMTACGH